MTSIPLKHFFELFGSGAAPGVGDQDYAGAYDRMVLLALSRTFRPRVVVEIGVSYGYTAALLLRECWWIERYVGVDLPADATPRIAAQAPEHPTPDEAGGEARADERFELLLADTRTLTRCDLPAAQLVYIDGSHLAEDVAQDTGLARAIVTTPGVIAWHDYNNDTPEVQGRINCVIDAINEAEGQHICLVEHTWTCFELQRHDPTRPVPRVSAVEVVDRVTGRGLTISYCGGGDDGEGGR